MLRACCFRSTEGRLDNVKNRSGLFPQFHFSLLSMYLGACMLHAVHETGTLVLQCIEKML